MRAALFLKCVRCRIIDLSCRATATTHTWKTVQNHATKRNDNSVIPPMKTSKVQSFCPYKVDVIGSSPTALRDNLYYIMAYLLPNLARGNYLDERGVDRRDDNATISK